MKNILVPSDFSECALNAVEAAISLAKQFNATVHILTKPELPVKWESMSSDELQDDHEAQQAILRVESLFEELKKRYPGAHLKTLWVSGKLHESVSEYVRLHNVDLVVMGSHGASGKSEYFIGSNTQKAVRTVHCPVLVVKEPLKQTDFKKVVYASNFNEAEIPAFRRFLDFIKPFNPEIHLVAIHASVFDAPFGEFKEAMKPFEESCKPLGCQSHVYKDISVDEGIRSFSRKIGADLVAISNQQRHPLKRMLVGSNVEALVNHSDLPVLTVDFE